MNLRNLVIVFALLAATQIVWADGNEGIYKLDLGTSWGSTRGVHFAISGIGGKTADFDDEQVFPTPMPSGVLVGIHKQHGTNWIAPTAFYGNEFREPVAIGTPVTIDDVYLWATPDVRKSDLHLCLAEPPALAEGLTYKLKLLSVPSGVTYNGPTEWGVSDKVVTLPFYSTSDGTTGYKFRIEITANE